MEVYQQPPRNPAAWCPSCKAPRVLSPRSGRCVLCAFAVRPPAVREPAYAPLVRGMQFGGGAGLLVLLVLGSARLAGTANLLLGGK